MAGFLKKLFGGGQTAKTTAAVPHKDFMIDPAPQRDGGVWRIAGSIYQDTENERRERSFMRADTFSTEEDAIKFTILKGQQIIDQNGPRILEESQLGRPL